MATSARDRIQLRGVRFSARVGILPGESAHPQPLLADLDLWLDLSTAARSDQLDAGFDYRELPPLLLRATHAGPCGLLEHLAARLLDEIFAHAAIQRARVRLSKVRPPLGEEFGVVSVQLDRERGQWLS